MAETAGHEGKVGSSQIKMKEDVLNPAEQTRARDSKNTSVNAQFSIHIKHFIQVVNLLVHVHFRTLK